jgi:hypothetical protein
MIVSDLSLIGIRARDNIAHLLRVTSMHEWEPVVDLALLGAAVGKLPSLRPEQVTISLFDRLRAPSVDCPSTA